MPTNPDRCQGSPAAGVVIAEALDRPRIAIQELEQPCAGLVGKGDFRGTAANLRLGLRRVEVLEPDILAPQPERIAVDHTGLVGCVRTVPAHIKL